MKMTKTRTNQVINLLLISSAAKKSVKTGLGTIFRAILKSFFETFFFFKKRDEASLLSKAPHLFAEGCFFFFRKLLWENKQTYAYAWGGKYLED
jgi:hypothetical protein